MQNEIITYTQHHSTRGHVSAQASGRSMIEMLGVLAIIGALSVGGLAALRVAQNKLRANVIANDVMLAAADLLARQDVLTAGSVVNTFSFTPKTTTLTAEKCPEDANIEIMITGIPQAVCEQVVRNGAVKGTQGIGVAKSGSAFCDGSTLNSSCLAGNNNLVFVLGANTRELCGGQYCNADQYCRYATTGCHIANRDSGTCTLKGDKPASITAGGITFFKSPSNNMNYWSVISWCRAQGGSAMPQSTISALSSTQRGELKSLFNSDQAWLAEDGSNDCGAYFVRFDDGYVGISDNRSYGRYALCQEE